MGCHGTFGTHQASDSRAARRPTVIENRLSTNLSIRGSFPVSINQPPPPCLATIDCTRRTMASNHGGVRPRGMLVGKCRHGVVVDTIYAVQSCGTRPATKGPRDSPSTRLSVFPMSPKKGTKKGTAAPDARFELNFPSRSADGCYRTKYAGDTKREVRYDAMSPHFDARLVSQAGPLPRAILVGILVLSR